MWLCHRYVCGTVCEYSERKCSASNGQIKHLKSIQRNENWNFSGFLHFKTLYLRIHFETVYCIILLKICDRLPQFTVSQIKMYRKKYSYCNTFALKLRRRPHVGRVGRTTLNLATKSKQIMLNVTLTTDKMTFI